MSTADVSDLAATVTGIKIDGPGGPTTGPNGRIELNDTDVTQVLPGELDPAVGSQPQPAADVLEQATNALTNAVADIIEEAVPGTFGDERLPVAADGDALFDPHAYDATPVLDGQATTELQVTFAGGVKFEAADENAQKLFASLRLGRWVELRVAGFVASKQGGYKENAEGESTVTGKAGIKVTDMHVLAPEELYPAAARAPPWQLHI